MPQTEPESATGPQTPAAASHAARAPGLTRALRLLIYLAVAGFFAKVLAELDWSVLLATRLGGGWLLLAVAIGWLVRLAMTLVWGALVVGAGARVDDLLGFNLYTAKSAFGRYLPGKVGMVLGRVHLAPDLGTTPTALGMAALMEAGLYLVVTASVGALVVGGHGRVHELEPLLASALALGLLLVFAVPIGIARAAGWLTRRRQGPSHTPVILRRASLVRATALALGASVLNGLWCAATFATVTGGFPTGELLYLWGALNLAAAAGIAAVVTPSGIGVREAALVALLGQVATPEVAVTVAVLLRAIDIGVDASYLGLSHLACRLGQRPKPPSQVRTGDGSGH